MTYNARHIRDTTMVTVDLPADLRERVEQAASELVRAWLEAHGEGGHHYVCEIALICTDEDAA